MVSQRLVASPDICWSDARAPFGSPPARRLAHGGLAAGRRGRGWRPAPEARVECSLPHPGTLRGPAGHELVQLLSWSPVASGAIRHPTAVRGAGDDMTCMLVGTMGPAVARHRSLLVWSVGQRWQIITRCRCDPLSPSASTA